MEMENFKELLNKCNTQYEFVKICDLEQGKKYEVTCFENINTKFGKKISVILDKMVKERHLEKLLKSNYKWDMESFINNVKYYDKQEKTYNVNKIITIIDYGFPVEIKLLVILDNMCYFILPDVFLDMLIDSVKKGYIRLSHPEFNDNNTFKIGLESMYLKGINLINIESDCKIEIEQRVIHIKKDEYTISNLNKLIEPLFLSYDNKKIQIESPCYFNLDENLKKYLGFPNTTFDFSILCNTLMYCPTSEEKYINIDKECEFTIDKEDENSNSVYKIPIH
ncbi:hypothetical protein AGLY_016564 [Aphis glycines]|uniref:Uncharacterized protein n=1 Tax=Aphis glycines TaxID=307491 RepID=A0A6G0SX35_APHGL|nr:hypothetical protein AGLY_016564 [Aphis glycines]